MFRQKLIQLGRLYTYHISHFAGVLRVFSQNTPQNVKHSLYTFRILFKFVVNAAKKKL